MSFRACFTHALSLVIGAFCVSSCASTTATDDSTESLPPPTSIDALVTPIIEPVAADESVAEAPEETDELPALQPAVEDRSQISGWKVKDVTKELPTDRELTPSMEDPLSQGSLRQSTGLSTPQPTTALASQER